MKTENHLQNLRDLIAENKLSTALKYLRDVLEQTPHLNEVIHQTGRFESVTKQIRLGVVSHEDATITENQIRIGLLELISEIEIQQKNPEIEKELEHAISIINSKNVVAGSTISAGGNVNIGDTNIIHGEKKYPKYLTPNFPKFNADKFIGRVDTLQKLHTHLAAGKNILLNGLGGIGKSSVARMYCEMHKTHYDHFVWFSLTDSFENGLTLSKILHDTLGIDSKNEPQQIIAKIFSKLNEIAGNNLLIIDNADASLKPYIEQLPPTWKVLVTSREKMDDRFTEFPLGVMDFAEAQLLFAQYYTKAKFTELELQALCEEIGYHTLTLELLARTLQESLELQTISELTQYLQTNRLDAEVLQEEVFTQHSKEEKEIYTHLLQAFTLAELSEDEKWVLLQFAVLPPIAHEGKDFLNWIQVEDVRAYQKVLQKMNKKGWVERKDNSFRVHRLIQSLIRYQVEVSYENCKGVVDTFVDLLFIDQNKDNPVDKFQWIEYGVSLSDNIKDVHANLGDLNHVIAVIFFHMGLHEQAKKYCQRAIHNAELLKNSNSISVYEVFLAGIYQMSGKYKSAAELLEMNLEYYLKNFGEEDKNIITVQSNLADVYRNLGKYKEAAKLLEKALSFGIKSFGLENKKTITIKSNLALIYEELGRFGEAADLLERVLNINIKNLPKGHPSISISQSNLANVYKNMGRDDDAASLLEKALLTDLNNLGGNHPNVAIRQSNLGMVYFNLKRYKEAAELVEKSLISDLKNYGTEHPYVALRQSNLGIIYIFLRKNNKAKELLDKSYNTSLGIFGEESTRVADCLENIGKLHFSLSAFKKAITPLKKCYLIRLKIIGAEHPHTKHAKETLDLTKSLLK